MYNLNRRSFLTGTAVVAAATALSACAGKKPGGSAAPGGQSSANVWALTGGAPEQAFRTSFDEWNKAHPDKKIDVQFLSNDAYKEKIRTAVGSGMAPTLIFSWAGGTLKSYVDAGAVVDLTEGTKDLQKRLIPGVLDVGKVDGKIYAIPNNDTQPVFLYANMKVLKKAGLSEIPKTYDDLLAGIDKMKKAGISIPIALAGASQWPELMWIEYLLDRQAGAGLFQKIFGGDSSGWTDPDMLEAAKKIQELVNAGAFGDKFGSVVADASADAALLYTGKSGLLLQGVWSYNTFLKDGGGIVQDGDLAWGPFPTITGGKGDPKNVYGTPANFWSVSSKASETDQKIAIEYLNTALFNENYMNTLIAGGAIPVTTDAASQLSKADDAKFLSDVYTMATEAPSFQLSWDQALSASQAQTLLTSLSKLFLGQIKPEEFCEAMKAAK